MRFIFKMLVLVGMILVGKFLKEDATNKVVKKEGVIIEDTFSLNTQEDFPLTQQTQNTTQTSNKKESAGKTYTYSFN